jgi:hypothetical protein
MSSLAAWRDGLRRVNKAPAVLLGAWLITLLVSLPLAAAMRGLLRHHLGSSLAADAAASRANYDWMQEFSGQATGLGVTFKPAVLGFGAVVDNLSAFIDFTPQPIIIIGAASVYLVLWLFFAGGAIDRYARDRATQAHGFFAASGVFFFRFLRLAILMALVYVWLFGFIHPWMFEDLYPRLTREISVERTALFIRIALYAVFGILLIAFNVVFDYAKVRAVVEDRRSMLGATAAALRFIRRNYPAALGLYVMNAVSFLIVLGFYALVAPGAGGTGWSMWIGFLVGQAYVLARLWAKLAFWASETALFQGRLAHAKYVAAPIPRWPDSPVGEAIGR